MSHRKIQSCSDKRRGYVLGESVHYVLQPQASFVLIDQSSGYVKALSGGRGQKEVSRSLNRATNTLRQPGSTFKVITSFAPAIDTCGATLGSVYYDGPYTMDTKTSGTGTAARATWATARSVTVSSTP